MSLVIVLIIWFLQISLFLIAAVNPRYIPGCSDTEEVPLCQEDDFVEVIEKTQ